MAVFDESGECERVECPFCKADASESCDHVLMFADITFGDSPSGLVSEHLRACDQLISEAFSPKLTSDTIVNWKKYAVQQLWDALCENEPDAEDVSLPSKEFYELVLELLADAGGWEHPGSLVSGSGACCESAVRLMYAENPQQVIEAALKLLPSYLVEEEPKRRRKKR